MAFTDLEKNSIDTGCALAGLADKIASEISSGVLDAGSVETADLADLAVTSGKLALLAVDTAQLAADAVDGAKVADDAVSLEHLDAGITPSHIIVFAGEFTSAGGDVNETISVAGMLATDIVHVTIINDGASPSVIKEAVAVNDQIDVVMSVDPSTDHIFSYSVMRAAA